MFFGVFCWRFRCVSVLMLTFLPWMRKTQQLGTAFSPCIAVSSTSPFRPRISLISWTFSGTRFQSLCACECGNFYLLAQREAIIKWPCDATATGFEIGTNVKNCDEDICTDCPKDKGYAFFVDINRAVYAIFWDLMSEMLSKQSSLDPLYLHKTASEDNDKLLVRLIHTGEFTSEQCAPSDNRYRQQLAHFARLSRVPSQKTVSLVTLSCMSLSVSVCVYTLLPVSSLNRYLPHPRISYQMLQNEREMTVQHSSLWFHCRPLIDGMMDRWRSVWWHGMACVHPFQAPLPTTHHRHHYYYCSVLRVCLVIVRPARRLRYPAGGAEVLIITEEGGLASLVQPPTTLCLRRRPSWWSAALISKKHPRREAMLVSNSRSRSNSSKMYSVYFWMEGSESEYIQWRGDESRLVLSPKQVVMLGVECVYEFMSVCCACVRWQF